MNAFFLSVFRKGFFDIDNNGCSMCDGVVRGLVAFLV